jgi:hypothetical protein
MNTDDFNLDDFIQEISHGNWRLEILLSEYVNELEDALVEYAHDEAHWNGFPLPKSARKLMEQHISDRDRMVAIMDLMDTLRRRWGEADDPTPELMEAAEMMARAMAMQWEDWYEDDDIRYDYAIGINKILTRARQLQRERRRQSY